MYQGFLLCRVCGCVLPFARVGVKIGVRMDVFVSY